MKVEHRHDRHMVAVIRAFNSAEGPSARLRLSSRGDVAFRPFRLQFCCVIDDATTDT